MGPQWPLPDDGMPDTPMPMGCLQALLIMALVAAVVAVVLLLALP